MTWMPIDWARHAVPDAQSRGADAVSGQRIAGMIFRTIFIMALLAVTVRVSMPQSETIWTAYETPGDLIRLVLGFLVCIGMLIRLFTLPRDADAHRTWLYLGLAAVPFALICVFAVW
jgi:hypothetical protein